MSWLSDDALARLRSAASAPDLSATKYRLLSEIGRGGMCSVFLAEDSALGRRVALKVLDVPDPGGDLTERLIREAKVLAGLEHPGIAPVHDVGRLPDDRVFYAMKYVEGPRLDEYAATAATLPERLRVFHRIAEAVAFAHDRGILHRDLKPENIIVGPFGQVLVMDWGLAKILGGRESSAKADAAAGRDVSGKQTLHGSVLGTPGYMAPEQQRGEVEALDTRADVYSLGAVLRFLVSRVGETVPKPLLAICRKAMASDPKDRYESASALDAEISRYLDGERVQAYPERPRELAARLYARHKVAFWLIFAYLAVRGSLLFFSGR